MPDAVLYSSVSPPGAPPTVVEYPDGRIEFIPVHDGYHVRLHPRESGAFLALDEAVTWFPREVVQAIADCHGFAWTAEVLARHHDPYYIERLLGHQFFSYFAPSALAGKRILDFGCGTGASTFALARLLPDCEVIGVDFEADRIAVAERIAELSDLPNVRFLASANPHVLPINGLGRFDYVVLCATLQHMLPAERRVLLPLLWKLLAGGGAMLISQTSHRWFPLEPDATGLFLVNYLPLPMASSIARHFSTRDDDANRGRSRDELLRAGLRGATESEILSLLPANAMVLQPLVQHSRAGYWRQMGSGLIRAMIAEMFAWTERRWGVVPSKHLDLVVRKLG